MRKKIIWGVLGLILICILISGFLLVRNWREPLGVELGMPTRPPAAAITTSDPDVIPPFITQEGDIPGSGEERSPLTTQQPEEPVSAWVPPVISNPQTDPLPDRTPICGGPGELLILAIAADTYDENYLYGLADAIRLVHIDFHTPRVRVLAMPRDLWVAIPDIPENRGITHGKLNQAYFYGNPGMGYYSGPGAGPGLLARTLVANYGVYVDHYGALSMRTFVDIIDSLGGIDVYLEAPVDGNADGGLKDYFEKLGYFPAGWNHMDGQTALNFSRIRAVDSTFGRSDRQSQVLLALQEKAVSMQGVLNIPWLINSFIGRVQTDLSKEQLSQLACLGLNVPRENIHFDTLPDSILTESRIYSSQLGGNTFIFDADPVEVNRFIQNYFYPPETP